MKYFAVIDTNVLVSAALKWHSVQGTVIELAIKGVVTPVLNEEILNEYRIVLSREKFHLPEDLIDAIINGLKKDSVFVTEESLDIDLPDPKDVVFYEVVMEKRKNDEAYLVTENIKHFPKEPFIVTPREFLDILVNEEQ